MQEKRPKPKLPRSVIVLNIILLILLVCGLTFSLAFSAIKKEEFPATGAPTSRDTSSELLNMNGITQSAEATEDEPPHTPPVPMTKRTTEPTEPPLRPKPLPSLPRRAFRRKAPHPPQATPRSFSRMTCLLATAFPRGCICTESWI